ncbi:hypothetical protein MTO96_003181 [Rhipicephalus appendiculatus]
MVPHIEEPPPQLTPDAVAPAAEPVPEKKTGISVTFHEESNRVYPGSTEEIVVEPPEPEPAVAKATSLTASLLGDDDRPPLVAVTAEPGMSKAKLHWLSAFNRIVNQLNEVCAPCNFLACACMPDLFQVAARVSNSPTSSSIHPEPL